MSECLCVCGFSERSNPCYGSSGSFRRYEYLISPHSRGATVIVTTPEQERDREREREINGLDNNGGEKKKTKTKRTDGRREERAGH